MIITFSDSVRRFEHVIKGSSGSNMGFTELAAILLSR